MKKEETLIISSAFAEDVNLWQSLIEECKASDLHLYHSDFAEQDQRFHFLLELRGAWHQIAKFELFLKKQQKNLGGLQTLSWTRRAFKQEMQLYLPYQVEVSFEPNATIVSLLTQFFSSQGAKIKHLRVQSYLQSKTAVPLQMASLSVWIPLGANLPELRENFMILCDEYHLDALFEQERI